MGDLPASELPMRLLHPIWNFNDDSGHLWYIYMLIGLYLFMPVLSPWLKQTGKKAELAFLAVWFVSSFLAYLKRNRGRRHVRRMLLERVPQLLVFLRFHRLSGIGALHPPPPALECLAKPRHRPALFSGRLRCYRNPVLLPLVLP